MEEWLPTLGGYEVSSDGRFRTRAGRIKAQPLVKGYPHVSLMIGELGSAKYKMFRAHRLVALAFLGPCPFVDAQVDHVNGIKADNRVENLEWVTRKENAARASRMGLYRTGDAHGSRIHPECLARGDANGSRTHPERLKRGDDHPRRRHPEKWAGLEGERHPQSKLTAEIVARIRVLYAHKAYSQQALGAMFGVSEHTVSFIVRRKAWKHVP